MVNAMRNVCVGEAGGRIQNPSSNTQVPDRQPGSAALTHINFKDLQTRGFVHVPGFLSRAELQEYTDDFKARGFDPKSFYPYKTASPTANAHASERVQEVLRLVREQTDLRVNLPQEAWYFATGKSKGINFPWHQDTESYWQTQNHYDYLNFYIPVMKERTDKSNLCVVPFDVLEREIPGTFRRLVRSGAHHFVRVRNKLVAYSDDSGAMHIVRGDLDRIAHTPLLAAGDLLLLRGDVIHRTQDGDTERIAMSFRVSSSQTIVKRSRLAYGGLSKTRIMAKHPLPYQKMFLAFDAAGRDEMPLGELTKLGQAVSVEPADQRDFIKYLLREKRRAGSLGLFAEATILAVARRMLNWKG